MKRNLYSRVAIQPPSTGPTQYTCKIRRFDMILESVMLSILNFLGDCEYKFNLQYDNILIAFTLELTQLYLKIGQKYRPTFNKSIIKSFTKSNNK